MIEDKEKMENLVITLDSAIKKLRAVLREMNKASADAKNENIDLFSELKGFSGKPINKKEKDTTIFHTIKDSFMSFYFLSKGLSYGFSGKDGASIKRIEKKLEKISLDTNVEYNKETVEATLESMYQWIAANDKFLFDNLSLGLFDSRLTNVASMMMKNKSGSIIKKEILDDLNKELGDCWQD